MPLFRIKDKIVLFVHVPKTGGTSIEAVLAEHGHVSLLMPKPDYLPTAPQHFHFAACLDLFPPGFYDYAFAIVRNPYDRVLSEYVYRRNLHGRVPPFDIWWHESIRRARHNPFHMDSHLRPQTEFLGDGIEVFRFEDGLDTIARSVCSRLGVAPPETMPRLRRHPNLPIQVAPATLDGIRDAYKVDFQELGYPDDPREVIERRRITVRSAGTVQSIYWSLRLPAEKSAGLVVRNLRAMRS